MNKSSIYLIGIVIIILGAAIGLAAWLQSISPQQAQPNPDIKGEAIFVRPHSYMTGRPDAKVTLVEFADFQCPACAAQYALVKEIVDKYKSNPDFNFVHRNFPLASHNNAKVSAEAAEAAGSQGKYWDMIELIYKNQDIWAGSIKPIDSFSGYAEQLGLDVDKFKGEVTASKYIDNIFQDYKDGEALGVNGTPSFFLNGERLGTIRDLDTQIQELLSK